MRKGRCLSGLSTQPTKKKKKRKIDQQVFTEKELLLFYIDLLVDLEIDCGERGGIVIGVEEVEDGLITATLIQEENNLKPNLLPFASTIICYHNIT